MKNISKNESCPYCNELSGKSDNDFVRIYRSVLSSRLLLRTENFVAFPSLGQLVPGHLLLVPKIHYNAAADQPADLIAEQEALRQRIREKLSILYGPLIFFEHGTRGPDCGGCGIYHAHIHAVPVDFAQRPEELVPEFSFRKTHSFEDLVDAVGRCGSYIFFENSIGEMYVAQATHAPSQLLRKRVAQWLGSPGWDWRVYGFEPILVKTWETLRPEFAL